MADLKPIALDPKTYRLELLRTAAILSEGYLAYSGTWEEKATGSIKTSSNLISESVEDARSLMKSCGIEEEDAEHVVCEPGCVHIKCEHAKHAEKGEGTYSTLKLF